VIVISLTLLVAVYATGIIRLWRSAGIGRGIGARDVACFAAAVLALIAALLSPIDEWSESLFAAHMLQHELLMVVAAPLLALSGYGIAVAWALPRRASHPVHASIRSVTRLSSVVPALACLTHAAALWLWHIPSWFEAAREHEAIHAAQHLTFFATAWWFWWSLWHGRYGRAGLGAAVLYLFATTVQSGGLGALLVVSPTVWYGGNSAAAAARGLTPLEDQQLGGLLMWVPASLIFVAAGLTTLAGWLRESDRRGAIATTNISAEPHAPR
jgi:putative membrane protein